VTDTVHQAAHGAAVARRILSRRPSRRDCPEAGAASLCDSASALGVEGSYWHIWTKPNGFDLFQITSWAIQSVVGACSHEPCTP
jgi:hypothetical protein